ncbi:MAG: FtsW/RodA/SpoVE family cell cycle protein [Micavibrio sp.]
MNTLFTRTDKTIWGRWWWTVDRPLLGALLTLMVFGVLLVAAASPPVATRIGLDQYHFVIRHLVIMIPAVILMIGISLLDLKNLWRLATLILIAGLVMMVVVLATGMEIKGAQRWLQLPGLSLQPSEFVKPAFAVVAAWLISKQKDRPEFPGYMIAGVVFFLVITLLLMQPDVGMTIVAFCILCTQIFLAGLPLWIVFAAVAVGGACFVLGYFTLSHMRSRIDRFLDPASGDNFQVDRALEAFRHGGLLGTGPGQGTVKLSIPDAHSDFIFAVAGEELGFVFLAVLLAVLAFIVLRGFNRVMDSDNMFVILATGGLLVMFGIQALVHIGSNVHLIPTKGMTLPFISYGGSSLLAISVTMGMVLALTRRHPKTSVSRSSLSSRPLMAGRL